MLLGEAEQLASRKAIQKRQIITNFEKNLTIRADLIPFVQMLFLFSDVCDMVALFEQYNYSVHGKQRIKFLQKIRSKWRYWIREWICIMISK